MCCSYRTEFHSLSSHHWTAEVEGPLIKSVRTLSSEPRSVSAPVGVTSAPVWCRAVLASAVCCVWAQPTVSTSSLALQLEALVSLRILDSSPPRTMLKPQIYVWFSGQTGKRKKIEKMSRIPPKLWSIRARFHRSSPETGFLLCILGAYTSAMAAASGSGPGEKREGSPAVPHSGSDSPPVQSSLRHSHPAHGAVLRLELKSPCVFLLTLFHFHHCLENLFRLVCWKMRDVKQSWDTQ